MCSRSATGWRGGRPAVDNLLHAGIAIVGTPMSVLDVPSDTAAPHCAVTTSISRNTTPPRQLGSAVFDDLTQHVERFVSRRKSRIAAYLK
jgi:hypothetical protein